MDVQECLAEVTQDSISKCTLTRVVWQSYVRDLHVQVKQFAGKDVYKGVFLPLLRVYRQDQDVEKLTSGNAGTLLPCAYIRRWFYAQIYLQACWTSPHLCCQTTG